MHTSWFAPVGNNCYAQLSGEALYELYPQGTGPPAPGEAARPRKRRREEATRQKRSKRRKTDQDGMAEQPERSSLKSKKIASLADVAIPRAKMFYGQKPAQRRDGRSLAGLPPTRTLSLPIARITLRHIDLLNTLSPSDPASALALTRTIFPSVYGLRPFVDHGYAPPSGSFIGTHDLVSGLKRPKRAQAIMIAMRELLARHKAVDYRKEWWKVQQRRGMQDQLEAVSHSQVGIQNGSRGVVGQADPGQGPSMAQSNPAWNARR